MPSTSESLDDLQLISVGRAASLLDCDPVTLRRKVATGELRGYRLGPRMLRVELAQIKALRRPVPTAKNTA